MALIWPLWFIYDFAMRIERKSKITLYITILAITLAFLGVIRNLSTFFRHSDSYFEDLFHIGFVVFESTPREIDLIFWYNFFILFPILFLLKLGTLHEPAGFERNGKPSKIYGSILGGLIIFATWGLFDQWSMITTVYPNFY